ncbi:hypothetical protein DRN72_04665 [Methanosarcinales archaeon]|nr:MAG: hypothetical protein DRN72_04665 [Methanosarcinales archaeon]
MIARKLVHIGGGMVYAFVSLWDLAPLLLLLLLPTFIVLYIYSPSLRVFEKEGEWVAKGAFMFHIGALLCVLLFPPPACAGAIAVCAMGDGFSAIGGKLVGGRLQIQLKNNKTIEGFLIGILFAFLGALCFLSPSMAFVGALCGMCAELLTPRYIDDNLSVQLCAGAGMMLYDNIYI